MWLGWGWVGRRLGSPCSLRGPRPLLSLPLAHLIRAVEAAGFPANRGTGKTARRRRDAGTLKFVITMA